MFLSKIAIFLTFAVMVSHATYLLVELEDTGSPKLPNRFSGARGLPGKKVSGLSPFGNGNVGAGGKFLCFVVKINMIVDHIY